MKYIYLLLFTFSLFNYNIAQTCNDGTTQPSKLAYNMTKLAQWDDDNLSTRLNGIVSFNDIWGYSAPDPNNSAINREYAIIGSTEFIHIFDITETDQSPDQLKEVARIEGSVAAAWRDFKTYKHYAYCVADEGEEGLIILDLSELPEKVTKVYQSTEFFNTAHNIFVDNGRLYVVGQTGEPANGDIVVLDISTDPAQPQLLSRLLLRNSASGIESGYVHDIYVKDNIAYCSYGGDDIYGVWDFNEPTQPVLIGAIETPVGQHSSWVTEDGKYAVSAAEAFDAPLLIIEVDDVTNMEVVQELKMPLLANKDHYNNMPHNPFIKGDRLYVSYYADGLQVFDISDPLQPMRIGWYDTEPCNSAYNIFEGNWGVYPFFESGKIIASDLHHGLFVLKLNEKDKVAPTELTDFTAKVKGKQGQFSWVTYSEMRDVKFILEKYDVTTDKWVSIVEEENKGRIRDKNDYLVYGDELSRGINKYRLAQKTPDGLIAYSDPVELFYLNTDVEFTVVPTLITNDTEMTLVFGQVTASNASIRLFNAVGQLITSSSSEIDSNSFIPLAVPDLPIGTYTIRVDTKSQSWTQIIVRQ